MSFSMAAVVFTDKLSVEERRVSDLSKWRRGGCHCGAITYEVRVAGAFDAGYCHCAICRRVHGAPVVAWALVASDSIRILSGTPRYYWSSPEGRRGFCGNCGSHLFYNEQENAEFTGFYQSSLDEPVPEPFRPRLHMCMADRLDWFAVDDGLPTFPENELTHPDRR